MPDLIRSGSCLCGAVEFEVTLLEKDVHVCHCGICQKWHGGVGFGLKCEKDWMIKGEENLKWFDTSEWAKRSFCNKCGSHLLFKTNDGSYHGVSAGALNNQGGLKVGVHIFYDKKLPYFEAGDDSPRLTEKEFLEHIGATES